MELTPGEDDSEAQPPPLRLKPGAMGPNPNPGCNCHTGSYPHSGGPGITAPPRERPGHTRYARAELQVSSHQATCSSHFPPAQTDGPGQSSPGWQNPSQPTWPSPQRVLIHPSRRGLTSPHWDPTRTRIHHPSSDATGPLPGHTLGTSSSSHRTTCCPSSSPAQTYGPGQS